LFCIQWFHSNTIFIIQGWMTYHKPKRWIRQRSATIGRNGDGGDVEPF
jgi:hypothetical protein